MRALQTSNVLIMILGLVDTKIQLRPAKALVGQAFFLVAVAVLHLFSVCPVFLQELSEGGFLYV